MAKDTNTLIGTGDKEGGDKGKEEKLIAGKYKTQEEFVKGYGKAQKKITELGQEKAKLDIQVQKLQLGKLTDAKEAEKKVLQAAQVKIDEEEKVLAAEIADAFDAKKGSPTKALALFKKVIAGHPSVKGGMSKSAYEQDNQRKVASATAVDKVRKDHMEDFDLLKPKMSKLWDKLPEEAKVPEMVETIYLAAKAASTPELREKIIEEMRAGSSTETGALFSTKNTDEDKKKVAAIVAQHKKDLPF